MAFNSGYTLIKTIEGDRNIKDLIVGTSVLTSQNSYHLIKKNIQSLIGNDQSVFNIKCEDGIEAYRFLGSQLVMSGKDGWKHVSLLQKGETVLTFDGLKEILEIEKMETPNKVCYALEVNRMHCYFADGILVNDDC